MTTAIYESEIEQITLDVLHDDNGYTVLHGPQIVDGHAPENQHIMYGCQ